MFLSNSGTLSLASLICTVNGTALYFALLGTVSLATSVKFITVKSKRQSMWVHLIEEPCPLTYSLEKKLPLVFS